QAQHRLVRLRSQRQRGDAKLLGRLQGQEVRAFLVLVGQRQLVGAFLQRVDQVPREVFTGLDDAEVVTERACLGTDRIKRVLDFIDRIVDIARTAEISCTDAKPDGVKTDAGDCQG